MLLINNTRGKLAMVTQLLSFVEKLVSTFGKLYTSYSEVKNFFEVFHLKVLMLQLLFITIYRFRYCIPA